MATVNESRKLVVQYEEFCQDSRCVSDELLMKLRMSKNDKSYCGPEQFRMTRKTDVPNRDLIEHALSVFTTR